MRHTIEAIRIIDASIQDGTFMTSHVAKFGTAKRAAFFANANLSLMTSYDFKEITSEADATSNYTACVEDFDALMKSFQEFKTINIAAISSIAELQRINPGAVMWAKSLAAPSKSLQNRAQGFQVDPMNLPTNFVVEKFILATTPGLQIAVTPLPAVLREKLDIYVRLGLYSGALPTSMADGNKLLAKLRAEHGYKNASDLAVYISDEEDVPTAAAAAQAATAVNVAAGDAASLPESPGGILLVDDEASEDEDEDDDDDDESPVVVRRRASKRRRN